MTVIHSYRGAPIDIVASAGSVINVADYVSQIFSGGRYPGYWLYSGDEINPKLGFWGTPQTETYFTVNGVKQADGWFYVEHAQLGSVQLVAGNEVEPQLIIQAATGSGPGPGAVTATNFWITIVPPVYNDPTPTQITGGDVVAAARAFYAAYAGISCEESCHSIAQAFASAAGAPLPWEAQSTNPAENRSGGLWTIVHRGNENPTENWQALLQPGDVVRVHWDAPGEGQFHTFTVLSITGDQVETIDNGNGTLFHHSANFQDYALPETVTIYRITRTHSLWEGEASNDTMMGSIRDDELRGLLGNDNLRGGTGNDIIYGNQGADLIYGNQGNDINFGGQGNDTLFGGQGSDVIYGNFHDDLIYGNFQSDVLFGGQGNDTIFGGQGNDTINGNLGNDRLFGNLDADTFVFGNNSGIDTVVGFSFAAGDRLSIGAQTYTTRDTAEGMAIDLSGGGTILLNGIEPQDFSAAFFA